ncbi:MAG: divalent metal cation transporter, partial [Erythrobacter sp.]
RFRSVWIAVLGCGIVFGLADIRPVPAIVLAQALNGLLLPVVAVFLLIAMRDPGLVGKAANGRVGNAAMVLVTAVAIGLGAMSLVRVSQTLMG